MVPAKPKVLFVDDEPNIRLTMGLYLDDQGFAVTCVATVAEALKLITEQEFDVLIADLNVGQPGDGFTVVSAMRRMHPQTVTFILTGYPAFETALEAIRLQVDDYITKPTDTATLAQRIREKLAEPKAAHHIQTRRLPEIIGENVPKITQRWLDAVRADPALGSLRLRDEERTDHVPRVLAVALNLIEGEPISEAATRAARAHGVMRRKQGYTIPLILRETRLLHNAVSECVQNNLLAIQISNLIPDMVAVHRTIDILMEEAVAEFLQPTAKQAS